MRISRRWAFIAVVAIIIGGSLIAKALSLFDVESEKEAVLIKTGEFAGQADPNDIRGSYSFADIKENFGVEPALLAQAFGIEGTPEEIAAYQCKGLEEKYIDAPEEIGTSSVRLFVGFLLGMPVELGSFLPESAVAVLIENAVGLTDERVQYLKEHTVNLGGAEEDLPESISSGEAAEGPVSDAAEVQLTAPKAVPEAAASQSVAAPAQKSTEAEVAPAEPAKSDEAQTDTQQAVETAAVEGQLLAVPAAETPAEEEHAEKLDRVIKGSTTISDMTGWGVKRDEIGPAIGIELPSDNGAKLRDLIIAAGKSFDEAKIVLQKLVDEAK